MQSPDDTQWGGGGGGQNRRVRRRRWSNRAQVGEPKNDEAYYHEAFFHENIFRHRHYQGSYRGGRDVPQGTPAGPKDHGNIRPTSPSHRHRHVRETSPSHRRHQRSPAPSQTSAAQKNQTSFDLATRAALPRGTPAGPKDHENDREPAHSQHHPKPSPAPNPNFVPLGTPTGPRGHGNIRGPAPGQHHPQNSSAPSRPDAPQVSQTSPNIVTTAALPPRRLPPDHPYMIEMKELKMTREHRRLYWLGVSDAIGPEWENPASFDRQMWETEERLADQKFAMLSGQIALAERGIYATGDMKIHSLAPPDPNRNSTVKARESTRPTESNRSKRQMIQWTEKKNEEAVSTWMNEMGATPGKFSEDPNCHSPIDSSAAGNEEVDNGAAGDKEVDNGAADDNEVDNGLTGDNEVDQEGEHWTQWRRDLDHETVVGIDDSSSMINHVRENSVFPQEPLEASSVRDRSEYQKPVESSNIQDGNEPQKAVESSSVQDRNEPQKPVETSNVQDENQPQRPVETGDVQDKNEPQKHVESSSLRDRNEPLDPSNFQAGNEPQKSLESSSIQNEFQLQIPLESSSVQNRIQPQKPLGSSSVQDREKRASTAEKEALFKEAEAQKEEQEEEARFEEAERQREEQRMEMALEEGERLKEEQRMEMELFEDRDSRQADALTDDLKASGMYISGDLLNRYKDLLEIESKRIAARLAQTQGDMQPNSHQHGSHVNPDGTSLRSEHPKPTHLNPHPRPDADNQGGSAVLTGGLRLKEYEEWLKNNGAWLDQIRKETWPNTDWQDAQCLYAEFLKTQGDAEFQQAFMKEHYGIDLTQLLARKPQAHKGTSQDSLEQPKNMSRSPMSVVEDDGHPESPNVNPHPFSDSGFQEAFVKEASGINLTQIATGVYLAQEQAHKKTSQDNLEQPNNLSKSAMPVIEDDSMNSSGPVRRSSRVAARSAKGKQKATAQSTKGKQKAAVRSAKGKQKATVPQQHNSSKKQGAQTTINRPVTRSAARAQKTVSKNVPSKETEVKPSVEQDAPKRSVVITESDLERYRGIPRSSSEKRRIASILQRDPPANPGAESSESRSIPQKRVRDTSSSPEARNVSTAARNSSEAPPSADRTTANEPTTTTDDNGGFDHIDNVLPGSGEDSSVDGSTIPPPPGCRSTRSTRRAYSSAQLIGALE